MDQRDNAEFINVGMEQPAEVDRHDDVVIKVDGPSNGKGWKIAAICAFVAVVGLGAGLVFMCLSSNDEGKKVDDIQAKLDARTEELNKFKEATGVDNADDVKASGIDVDLTEIYNAVPKSTTGTNPLFSLNGSYMKENNGYAIAQFRMGDYSAEGVAVGSAYTGYFYKALTDGEWKMSEFSGQAQTSCDDVTDEEKAAFKDIVTCVEE